MIDYQLRNLATIPSFMNKFIYALSLLLTSFALAAPSNLYASERHSEQSILVFGDSLSAAYNITREQGWVSLLQDFLDKQNLPIEVVNASISGETTGGGVERLAKQLNRVKPSVVILELGGNDGLRGFDLATTRKNLSQMIELSHTSGAHVLLAGIQIPPNLGRTYTHRFTQIYRDLGSREGVSLIPFILEGVATIDDLMQGDGIHPNAKGQPIIMQTVWHYLSPLLQKQ